MISGQPFESERRVDPADDGDSRAVITLEELAGDLPAEGDGDERQEEAASKGVGPLAWEAQRQSRIAAHFIMYRRH